jgi:hypothetical protein
MFSDTITLDFEGTDDLVLRKRKEGNYSSEYFGTVGDVDILMSIKHTFPKTRGSGAESHLVRFDLTEYDSDTGLIVRQASTWRVLATNSGRQDSTQMGNLYDSMSEFLDSTNVGSLLNGAA